MTFAVCRLLSRAPVAAVTLVIVSSMMVGCADAPKVPAETTFELADGWHLAAAAEVETAADEISVSGFDTAGWTSTFVPSTVMAALVRSGEFADPYFDKKLEEIPVERFAGPWWYRTEFEVKEVPAAGARLAFDGINYSADIWLNGRQIADRGEVLGAFRTFDLDVTGDLVVGVNSLAVLVYPPQPGDPTIGFVDWNPTSPDKNMGLWREVKLRLTGGVALDDLFVRSERCR